MLIYHIILPDKWEQVKDQSFYEPDSLAEEGFIHCSYEDQLDGVLERYYFNEGQVLVLSIDTNRLTSPLVSEPSTNDEPYPHIYGPINLDAVVETNLRAVGSASY